MSDSLAILRRRIRNTEELRSVVKTMKAMSAASITQFEQAAAALQDYDRNVELALSLCARAAALRNSRPAPRAGHGIIVFGTDQGMAGQFNEHAVEAVLERLARLPPDSRHRLWVVGERAQARLENAGQSVEGAFRTPQSVEAIASLISELLLAVERDHASGVVNAVEICLNAPELRSNYVTLWRPLLPLDTVWKDRLHEVRWPTRLLPEMVPPDDPGTWPALVSEFLFVTLYRAAAESCAAENAARLAAMQRAEKNIDDRRRGLDQKYNHQRQSTIDEELFDLVSGFEALTGRSHR